MQLKKSLVFCSLLCFLALTTGCNNDSSTAPEPGGETSTPSSYDPNWQPGSSALAGAVQPEVKNPTGQMNQLGLMRASASEAGLPQSGSANILVVPVEFTLGEDYTPDEKDEITEAQRTALSDAYFNESDSVVSYYSESSSEKLNLNGVVTPTVTLPEDFATYVLAANSRGKETVLAEITDYVYSYLFEETETYYSFDFDADKDGKIDNLVIAYSWDFGSWVFPGDTTYNTQLENFFSEGTFFNLSDDVDSTTWTTAKVDENHGVNQYVREVGRSLGLDYYFDSTGARAPLGNTDIMDEAASGDQNPFSKYLLGWETPTVYTAASVTADTKVTLTADNSIILAPSDVSLFGEYLIVDLATTADGFTEAGVRVYQVDSRLARENGEYFYPYLYSAETQFDDASYTFAYSNDSVNPLTNYGIDSNYPLVTLLDKDGSNRQMTDASITMDAEDLFKQGDEFGAESVIEGFYENFRFHGDGANGPKLGLTFTVDSITNNQAAITIRRAN